MELKKNFLGSKMNKTADERLIPEGQYRDALNINVSTTEDGAAGTVQNSRGNEKVTTIEYNGEPLLDATCIGSFADDKSQIIYFFVTSSAVDMIVSYSELSNITKYHVVDSEVLNFNKDYLINGIDLIDDMLFFTDNYNPPRKININRTYNNITEDDISVIVRYPEESPIVEGMTDAGGENYIKEKFISFAYRWRYIDGEYSALSQFSDLVFEPLPFKMDYSTMNNEGMVNRYNKALVRCKKGGKDVVQVDVCFKTSTSSVINVIERIDVTDIEPGGEVSVEFDNKKVYTVLPEAEILRTFDNVPKKAKAQSIVGNRLMYGNYIEGHNVDATIDYNLEVVSKPNEGEEIEANIDSVSQVSFDISDIGEIEKGSTIEVILVLEYRTQSVVVDGFNPISNEEANETPKEDITLTVLIEADKYYENMKLFSESDLFKQKIGIGESNVGFKYELNTTTDSEGNVLTSKYDLLDKTHYSLADSLYDSSIVPAVPGHTIFNTNDPSWTKRNIFYSSATTQQLSLSLLGVGGENDTKKPFQFINLQYINDTTDTANKTAYYQWFDMKSGSISVFSSGFTKSLHSDRDYEAGIVYMDDLGRNSTALVCEGNTVHVNDSLSETINSIKATINSKAPSWAKRYKFVLKPDKHGYETIYSNRFFYESDTASWWVKLDSDQATKVAKGDKLRVKVDSFGVVTNYVEAVVLEHEVKERNFIYKTTNEYDPDTNNTLQPSGVYIRLKPNRYTISDEDTEVIDNGSSSHRLKKNAPSISYSLNRIDETNIESAYDLKAGSIVNIHIKNHISGSSKKKEWIFDKEFVVSKDYDNFKEWLEGDNIEFSPTSNYRIPENAIVDLDDDTLQSVSNDAPAPPYIQYKIDGDKHYLLVKSGFTGKGGRHSNLSMNIVVVQGNDTIVFETKPQEANSEIYFEGSKSYAINDEGYHEGSDGVFQDASTPATVDLEFFDCYSFGNGVESYKIKDALAEPSFDLGHRTTAVSEQEYKEAHRYADITYSGIYNAETNINKLNEFNLGLANFKTLENRYGDIQVIHPRMTDILTLQSDRISKVMLGKNILSDAVGGSVLTSVPEVLGNQVARIEEFGISENPESFTAWGPFLFFTDSKRNAVIRMYGDKLDIISDLGMRTWFRDLFIDSKTSQKIGAYDPYSMKYTLSSNNEELPVETIYKGCGEVVSGSNTSQVQIINLTLDKVIGNVPIAYNISSGSVKIEVTNNGENVFLEGGTNIFSGSGETSWVKSIASDSSVTVKIAPIQATYNVTLACPLADNLSVHRIVIGNPNDIGQTLHIENTWTDFSGGTYGPNVVVNGDFTDEGLNWNAGAHLDFSTGEAQFTCAGDVKSLVQLNVLEPGNEYYITFDADITGVTSGSLKMNFGSFSNNTVGERTIVDGENELTLEATNSNFSINEGGAIGLAIFDNFTVRKVLPSNSGTTARDIVSITGDNVDFFSSTSGKESQGFIPYEGSIVTMRAVKDTSDTFEFDDTANSMKYLLSDVEYYRDVNFYYSFLLTDPNIVTPTPVSDVVSFTYSNPDEKKNLYLIWDLRNSNLSPPTITIIGDNPVLVLTSFEYVDNGDYEAEDYQGNDLTSSVVIDYSNIDTNTPGSYTANYSVTDSNGITGYATREVIIIESIASVGLSNNNYNCDDSDSVKELRHESKNNFIYIRTEFMTIKNNKYKINRNDENVIDKWIDIQRPTVSQGVSPYSYDSGNPSFYPETQGIDTTKKYALNEFSMTPDFNINQSGSFVYAMFRYVDNKLQVRFSICGQSTVTIGGAE